MSYILVGNNFYYCDSIDDVDYTWPEASRVFIKGTESYNGVYYTLTGGALIFKANQSDVKPLTDKQDTLISAENIKTINSSSILGSGDLAVSGGVNLVSGTSVFDFGTEQDTAVNTILSAAITNSNIKGFSVIPSQTTETSLDDFKLNGLTFNIENIIDGVSFDIRANSINNATGNYTVIYKIIY